jgi:hypothetical protein
MWINRLGVPLCRRPARHGRPRPAQDGPDARGHRTRPSMNDTASAAGGVTWPRGLEISLAAWQQQQQQPERATLDDSTSTLRFWPICSDHSLMPTLAADVSTPPARCRVGTGRSRP